ncbi:jhy protein homolog isoform X2 [Hoplias malabaricus]|uniref:jhy protein homolog isoform X2 n=1 Tax=Hoplias malabaricus TaxID=27720 RepID=UPI003461CF39
MALDNNAERGIEFSKTNDTSLRNETVSPKLWDSLESDTESLVQEKAYQRELQKRISDEASDNSHKPHVYVDVEENKSENCSDSCSSRDLEQETQPSSTVSHEVTGNITALTRQSPLGDEYADLRYDPDWRSNLVGAQFLYQVQTSLSLDSPDEHGDIEKHTEYMPTTGREGYVVVSNPALTDVNIFQPRLPSASFHLHPQENQISHGDTALPSSHNTSSKDKLRLNSDRDLKARDQFMDRESTAEISPSLWHGQQRDIKKQKNREVRSNAVAQEESKDKNNLIQPRRRHPRKVRQPRPKVDKVEHNKATLGMNTQKQGSYLKVYEQRGMKHEEENKLTQSSEDTSSTDSHGSPDNALDPELMWIQKTQKLKIHKENKCTGGPRHLRRPRPRVQMKPTEDRHVLEADHQPPGSAEKQIRTPSDAGRSSIPTSHQSFPSAPTVNLNVNLNTQHELTETFFGPKLQEPVYTLALPPRPQWRIGCNVYSPPLHSGYAVHQVGSAPQLPVSVLTPGHPHVSRDHLQGIGRRISSELIPRKHESSSARISSAFEEDANMQVPEVVVLSEEGVDSLTSCGGYPVLPPIRRSNTSDTELCADRTELYLSTLHRSSSEGYLAQLEKQRHLKAKTTYKTYSLKEYRSLAQEVKLGGLGPCNTVAEHVAEKIRRQKLYSNVIREQNKRISRIPILPARNPVSSDNKDTIPRNKEWMSLICQLWSY